MFSHFQARVGRTAVFQLLALALHGSRLIENMRQSIHVPIQSKRQTNDVGHALDIERYSGGQEDRDGSFGASFEGRSSH